MRCEVCPHMAKIKAALAPCQRCDNGSHHGASHVRADDFTLSHRAKSLDDHTPQQAVTNLDPDAEDKLRKAMTSLFGLDPLDLMLVQHLFNGGRLSNFNATQRKITDRLLSYHGTPRAQAFAARERIAKRFPMFAPVFKHLAGQGRDTIDDSQLDARNETIERAKVAKDYETARGALKAKASRRKAHEVKQGELFA